MLAEVRLGVARARARALRPAGAALFVVAMIVPGVRSGDLVLGTAARAQQAPESEPEPRRDRSYLIQLGFT
ncbi:MAG TPA: hypothetical protein VMF89_19675, partial [Polyangiales bacterium]|nr:hypothetical protein [Polyangiales bacterium]